MNKTINYYNQNADQFFDTTYQVDMTSLYQSFLRYLPEQASILDLGYGSGRDTLAFKNFGHQVEAIDYSEELVGKVRQLKGLRVQLGSFYELSIQGKYYGYLGMCLFAAL